MLILGIEGKSSTTIEGNFLEFEIPCSILNRIETLETLTNLPPIQQQSVFYC